MITLNGSFDLIWTMLQNFIPLIVGLGVAGFILKTISNIVAPEIRRSNYGVGLDFEPEPSSAEAIYEDLVQYEQSHKPDITRCEYCGQKSDGKSQHCKYCGGPLP